MRLGQRRRGPGLKIGVILLAVWLLIGVVAAAQRDYFKDQPEDCETFGTILVTILAGPLNYVGANPKIDCELPQPSP